MPYGSELISQLYVAGLAMFAIGVIGGAAASLRWIAARTAVAVFSWTACAGALLEAAAAFAGLRNDAVVEWNLPCGIPFFQFAVRLDPLSSFFLMTLAILGVSAAIYSSGYLRHETRNPGLAVALFNVLLASLTAVFTAADIVFFLIAWETMVAAAYLLIVWKHEAAESRHGGQLFILMSRVGTGMMLIGFLLLASAAQTTDFRALRALGEKLPGLTGEFAFVLMFFGFGVKAGIIPLHIWLPAAHPVAPSNISALMSGIVIKAGIYGMARVFFDFFRVLPEWSGMLVLMVGVISALLGVLYALMEHDLKRLLAYHSIENIGIILMGFGAALLFRAWGHPALASLALIAGLYHMINHAIFKCLLFLGAGSVLHATHTRNMEQLGGLVRRMPATAAFFLVGAIAISGLPPLNGFVSEWLTYQALLAGFGATPELTRVALPIAGALLALTAALAAACFVKAFGITFLALPRSPLAAEARECGRPMQAGMALLAAACVTLGLGATWFLPAFDRITRQLFGVIVSPGMISEKGIVLRANPTSGTVSPLAIAILLAGFSVVPLVLSRLSAHAARRRIGPTWDCGLPGLTADNEYTATAFSKPLRMIFSALFRPRREIQAEFDVSPYYPKAIHFESEIQPAFEKHIYQPLEQAILRAARRLRPIQAGNLHAYLAYIFITLILLLLFAVRG